MLGIAEAGDVIVNGAILEDSFMRYYETARRLGSRLVGVADVGGRPGPRDLEIDGVPHVRVVHSGSIAFGPTLAIVVNHRPVNEYINDLLGVVERVPGAVRQCVDEGVVLGIYALMVGQSMTPWFPGAAG
ncbi:hypothetical protein [Vulcanisaeta sp. JCM 16161]|uniref:hypothetical protein n=1 Tax=Vulcanisaeta sp. JCM 16161 TaxID=1295372 RepID=UPI0006CF7FA0|nr:hypothetical protein [Vulcanisaeta sp. JCM 16161]